MAPPKVPLGERIEKWTTKTDSGCWEWTAKRDKRGYGYIKHEGEMKKAARVAYEFYKGPIPEGLVLDHLCRNTGCVNPDHLEPVTQRVNWQRGLGPEAVKQRKVFVCETCGHSYEVLWQGRGRAEYGCRYCRADRAKEWRAKTGYDFSDYYAANKDRINARRRERRRGE